MKSKRSIPFLLLILSFIFMLISGCSSDDDENDPTPDIGDGELSEQGNVLTADDFDTYQGALGIIYSARNIAKKGYQPATAEIVIGGSQGNYSQTIDLDSTSFMGRLEIPVEDLSDEARRELQNGVPVEINVKDKLGMSIHTGTISALAFASNPDPSELNAFNLDETAENRELALNFNRDYVMQLVDEDGNVLPRALTSNSGIFMTTGTIGSGAVPDAFHFKIQGVNSNTPDIYLIKNSQTGQYLINFLMVELSGIRYRPLLANSNIADALSNPMFHFRFIKKGDGVYQIRSAHDNRNLTSRSGLNFSYPGDGEANVFIRIISDEINWSVANISTSFVAPILPKPTTSFGANSTLTNCTSAGGLSQTVGTNLTEERTTTVGWSESLSITSTNSISVGAEVSATFDATFFGVGSEYEVEFSTEYSYSRSVTESSSNFGQQSNTNSQNVFFERTVTVPPQSASLVYDVAQFYANTEVQIAQKLRIRGTYDNGSPVSGRVMATLFRMSRFNGIITRIGPDFIDVNLRGTMILDKVLETESKVQEVQPDCN